VREHYGELLDGFVSDEPLEGPPATLLTGTRMDGAVARRALARSVVDFAASLA
jgi:hypothetical protein